MDLQIEGRVAVVTGGDSGIGRATAKMLVAEGVKVVLSDVQQGPLDEAAEDVRKAADRGGEVLPIAADLTSWEATQELAHKVQQQTGGAHILAHFAGTRGAAGDYLEIDDAGWQHTIDVDLMGAVRTTRAFIPQMLDAGWGRVLLVASENAVQPYPEEIPYNCCKAAIVTLSKGLSKLYAERGVLVNCLSPAYVATPMTNEMMEIKSEELNKTFDETVEWFLEHERPNIEVGRRGQPEEVAAVAALLCSERASYVNGANWRVDGGSVATSFG